MKKLLSIILVALMIVSMVPIANAAYENTYSNTGNQRNDIIGVAKTQVNYVEGSNNNNKYGSYFGHNNVEWCAYFIVWCARQAGIDNSIIKQTGWADADDLGVDYRARGSYTPQKGDIIIFDYSPRSSKTPASAYGDHVGLVEYVSNGYVHTIEGNANNGVRKYSYSLSNNDIKGYGIPNYNNDPIPTIDNSFPYTFKCRTISTSNTKCYDSVNGSSAGSIYPTDDCEIQAIYTNGWVKCRCPWDDGTTKTVYVKKSVFINSSSSAVKMTAPKYALTYLRAGDTSSWGWIDKGDTIYKVATSGNMTQIIYPASSGLRCAWVKSSELVEPHSHSYSSSVTTQPTCTKEGVKTYKCTCSASYTEAIAKKSHSIVTISAVAATCTKTGLTEGKKCSTCGTVTVAQQTVAKKSHSYSSSITTKPTCTKEGVKTYKCSCGANYTEKIAEKAHSIVTDNAIAATCTKTGLTEGKHCSVCGTVTVSQKSVDKISHYDNNFDGKCDGCGISSATSSTPESPVKSCSCKCHKGDFFFSIILFFQKLFGMNKVCACGVKH